MVIRELPGGDGLSLGLTFLAGELPINITLDEAGIQIQTEAVFELNSQATNITSDEVSVESDDTNFSGAALTIESGESNIAGDALTIESLETNIASASLDVESGEFNIAAPAVTLEGTLDVVGAITEDGLPVLVIPV